MPTRVTLSISSGQIRLPSRLYACSSLAPLSSAFFTRPSMKSALLLLITGVIAALSCSPSGCVSPPLQG